MSSLSDASSLAIATLDLSLVQDLTQAMRTADLAAASAGTSQPISNDASHRDLSRSETQNRGLRYSDHPAATFEKCCTYHHHPRYQELQPYNCPVPVQPVDNTPSIQPPWKTLAWPSPHPPILPPGHRVVKVQQNHTDVSNVGQTLDLFV